VAFVFAHSTVYAPVAEAQDLATHLRRFDPEGGDATAAAIQIERALEDVPHEPAVEMLMAEDDAILAVLNQSEPLTAAMVELREALREERGQR